MYETSEGRAATLRETVLVVESDEFTRHRLKAALRADERDVHVAASGAEGLALLQHLQPQLVVLSLDLSDLPGAHAVEVVRHRARDAAVIAVSSDPGVSQAVEAMRRGALDYVGTHEDVVSRLGEATERALQGRRTERQLQRVREDVRDQYGFNQLLTQSPRILNVFDEIRQVARTDATALILGETGTGKELVSRAIHQRSSRADRPFISVNCGAFTESLLESELFGHEKGSFTGAVDRHEGLFEMADGGTLFLDELGETTPNVQVNLLRVLEEMTFRRVGGREAVHVDVRIVAATHVHLEQAVRDGAFRQDLFYRLNVFPIQLPPLRERREDIPLLMRHFLDEIAAGYGLQPPTMSADAIRAILAYPWPGNVRQLRAMCERWVITRAGARLEREALPVEMSGHRAPAAEAGGLHVDEHASMKENCARVVEQVERAYLFRVLTRCEGHLGKTASEAGITRRTLYTKMRQHRLDQGAFKPGTP